MPKHRDPTMMEKLQREDLIQSQLRASAKKNVSPRKDVKKAVKIPNPEGMGRRGLPR